MSLLDIAKRARVRKINAIHGDLNSAVMDLQALMRADNEETRQNIAARAMMNIKDAKKGMADLGMEYQA